VILHAGKTRRKPKDAFPGCSDEIHAGMRRKFLTRCRQTSKLQHFAVFRLASGLAKLITLHRNSRLWRANYTYSGPAAGSEPMPGPIAP